MRGYLCGRCDILNKKIDTYIYFRRTCVQIHASLRLSHHSLSGGPTIHMRYTIIYWVFRPLRVHDVCMELEDESITFAICHNIAVVYYQSV